MGEIMLNGRPYSAGISYKELTQAEYNALPDSKYTDGIMYCIKDGTGGVEGFPPLIYSDEAREIGVWRNGKPLYQKSYYISTFPNASIAYIPHGINNIDEIVEIKGTAHVKASVDSSNVWTQLSRVQDNNTNGLFAVDINGTNIVLKGRNSDFSGLYDKGYVTLQYTKTTDTAGSGKWTTQGEVAHHYSTTERVVGTWTDNKPIYEKTLARRTYTSVQDWTVLDANDTTPYDLILDAKGYVVVGNKIMPQANVQASECLPRLSVGVTDHKLYYYTNENRNAAITLRYTKTID